MRVSNQHLLSGATLNDEELERGNVVMDYLRKANRRRKLRGKTTFSGQEGLKELEELNDPANQSFIERKVRSMGKKLIKKVANKARGGGFEYGIVDDDGYSGGGLSIYTTRNDINMRNMRSEEMRPNNSNLLML